jgi:signal recognition particle subunit SRP54
MFESLTDKLGSALRNLRGVGKLSEENMAETLKEVRTALLAADVHFKVARDFVERVQVQCVGQEVLKSVTPGQQVVKIINDELVRLLGEGSTALSTARPLKILMVGLHGSGKTTSTAKLGKLLKKRGYRPLVAACDIYRPAAIDQLEILAKQEELAFYADRSSQDVPAIGVAALTAAQAAGCDCIIFDTAGRLQIDADLIEEVKRLHAKVQPDEVLLVADGALGQEAVNVAKTFHDALALTGLVLTKLDGDARGGAALSMKAITGVPIKFVGTGEKTGDFDTFYPDRLASRILGMGDVVSLVEKAQESIDQKEAEKMAEKMRKADFNLEDFLAQMQQVKKMGSMQSIIGMMPGMSGLQLPEGAAPGAPQARPTQRQPPPAHRQGRRGEDRRGQPAAEAIPADAKDDEDDEGRRREEDDAPDGGDEGQGRVSRHVDRRVSRRGAVLAEKCGTLFRRDPGFQFHVPASELPS